MKGETVFKFKCGSSTQARQVADWLECEDWPDDLRLFMEEAYGSFENIASIVRQADARGRNVVIQATDLFSIEMTMEICDYALSRWRSVPSPQGFTFGLARQPTLDPETSELKDLGEFDGGAVFLRRDTAPEFFTASSWLKMKMRKQRHE